MHLCHGMVQGERGGGHRVTHLGQHELFEK